MVNLNSASNDFLQWPSEVESGIRWLQNCSFQKRLKMIVCPCITKKKECCTSMSIFLRSHMLNIVLVQTRSSGSAQSTPAAFNTSRQFRCLHQHIYWQKAKIYWLKQSLKYKNGFVSTNLYLCLCNEIYVSKHVSMPLMHNSNEKV